jgi:hypothetical protein
MAPLTALVIGLCGISLLLGAGLPAALFGVAQVQSVLSRRLAHFSAGLALLLCFLRLAAYFLGWNLGLDSIGLAQTAAAHGMQPIACLTSPRGLPSCVPRLRISLLPGYAPPCKCRRGRFGNRVGECPIA